MFSLWVWANKRKGSSLWNLWAGRSRCQAEQPRDCINPELSNIAMKFGVKSSNLGYWNIVKKHPLSTNCLEYVVDLFLDLCIVSVLYWCKSDTDISIFIFGRVNKSVKNKGQKSSDKLYDVFYSNEYISWHARKYWCLCVCVHL